MCTFLPRCMETRTNNNRGNLGALLPQLQSDPRIMDILMAMMGQDPTVPQEAREPSQPGQPSSAPPAKKPKKEEPKKEEPDTRTDEQKKADEFKTKVNELY